MQVSQQVDQSFIVSLKIEQTHLISSLKNKHESFEKKITRLGEIIEERFKRNDSSLAKEGILIYNINQISDAISKLFERMHLAIAPHVPDYCHERWKDATKSHKKETDECPAERSEIDQLLELASKARQLKEQYKMMSFADRDLAYVFYKETIRDLERIATDQGQLLTGHEQKDPKATPKSEPRFTKEWQAIEYFRMEACKEYQDYVYRFPGPPEKEAYWASGWNEFSILLKDIKNLKRSLVTVEWHSRIQYMFHQSKHGAAVYKEIETMICDECFDDETGKEKPDCNAEMEWDNESITGYRCPTCGGTSGVMRGLTREQCGDNKAPVLHQSQRLIYSLPAFFEALDKRITEIDKRVYGRKVLLSEDLRKEA